MRGLQTWLVPKEPHFSFPLPGLQRDAQPWRLTEACWKTSVTSVTILSKQPEGSQCEVETDFVWATVLLCLWQTACFSCHCQLFICLDIVWTLRAGWNGIKIDKEKQFLLPYSFSCTYLPFFSLSLLTNIFIVYAWMQFISALSKSTWGTGNSF